MSQRLVFTSSLERIQEIRLLHALLESEHEFCLSPLQGARLRRVCETFGLRPAVAPPDAAADDELPPGLRLRDWEIDHESDTPVTRIGTLARPLIFPHGVWDWAQPMIEKNADARPVRWLFMGLLTPQRRQVLGDWIARNAELGAALPPETSASDALWNFRARVLYKLRLPIGPRDVRMARGDVLFWASERGRHFPDKAWDKNYYRAMGQARFVLCPNGNSIWSYRFFEAILCGALPVVQQSCDAYDGFTYASMSDRAADIEWNPEIARANFALCRQRLTIPLDQLNAELKRLKNSA